VPCPVQCRVYFIHPDHLDTPRAVVNANDQPIWLWVSAPFGDTAANENPTAGLPNFTFNLRFPGQEYDRETGTHYNYFRDYEAGTGRYVQSDPVGLFGGVATFQYADSDPIETSDNFGLKGSKKGKGKKGCCGKEYLTNFADDLNNPGKIYVGRTSGQSGESSQAVLNRRKAGHHRNLGPLNLDRRSCNKSAIRGREQMMMKKMKKMGIDTNQIKEISLRNEKRNKYLNAATNIFGMP